jgi:tellurite resistance protein TerC
MIWLWVGFIAFILAMLALDLGVFHRKAHVVSIREALAWSAVWITMALLFNVLLYFIYANPQQFHLSNPEQLSPANAAAKFFFGYVIEKSLSVDNIFVIALVFTYFGIPAQYQHRVLFWGIMGALVMRGMFIGIGAVMIARFHWILYIFGVFLIFTAWKMLLHDIAPDPKHNIFVRTARRWFPITYELHGQRFIMRRDELRAGEPLEPPGLEAPKPAAPVAPGNSTWVLTPLALTLLVIEGTDLVFAVDSIPAIFGITTDPFIVFTSNVFAILGLRALYFALAGIIDKFRYLKTALALVLGVVGVKMLAADWLEHRFDLGHAVDLFTLGLIGVILTVGIVLSILAARRESPVEIAVENDA